jgi:hypothetical protein
VPFSLQPDDFRDAGADGDDAVDEGFRVVVEPTEGVAARPDPDAGLGYLDYL